jgi:hypothetical protein
MASLTTPHSTSLLPSGRGGYNAPLNYGRGGYNTPCLRSPDDDDEAEDGRGGYN